MAEKDEDQRIVKRAEPVGPIVRGDLRRTIQLGQQDALDVSNLSTQEQDALEAKAVGLAIDRDDRAQRLRQDLAVTGHQVKDYVGAVKEAAAHNATATITNTKDDSLGRTEIIIGNSEAARTGKLSRSQEGFAYDAKFWITLAIIAGAVIVLVAVFSS